MAHGKSRLSEAAVNNALGRMLWEKNVRWQNRIESEKTGVLLDAVGKRPDIIVNHPDSLPVIIETEFEPARTVEKDAQSRLGRKLSADGRRIEQVIALKIPSNIVMVNQQHLEEALSKAEFQYALLMVNGLAQTRWPEKGYIKGGIDDFVSFVEQTALSESIMNKGMEVLENSISIAANIIQQDSNPNVSTQKRIAELLKQVESEQTTRMAMAILANAVSFHNSISNLDGVLRLVNLMSSQGYYVQSKISDEWKRIYTEINYWPILYIAREILNSLPPIIASRVFSVLVESAQQLERIGATSQHDLSGRMLQRLIADRKFLATFYTLHSSATLLAELAISRLNVDWSKPEEITNLQIGDFACGTGALLNAAYSSVLARYRRTGGNDSELHAPLIEKTLVGTDIMPAATHLTASILSSAHPAVPFENTRIITLPYGKNKNAGGDTIDLGSLDLIKDENVFSLFQTSQDRVKGGANGDSDNVPIPHKSFDLVIMNPPFTRICGQEGNRIGIPLPSFAGFSTSHDEQYAMSKKLSAVRNKEFAGTGNAGLASYFIDVADSKVKEGGLLALVIPLAFVVGKAWENARRKIERNYKEILIISITRYKAKDRAFSADTGMGEILLIATRSHGTNEEKPTVTYVNLTHRPASIVESGVLSKLITEADSGADRGTLRIGEHAVGQFIRSDAGFGNYVGISDLEIARVAVSFSYGRLELPRSNVVYSIPTVKLSSLGTGTRHPLTFNRKQEGALGTKGYLGPFDIADVETPMQSITYPMLWNHDCEKETRLVVDFDKEGKVRVGCEARAQELWDKYAGKLCFNQDFRLNSQPLAACFSSVKAIGGRAWPGFRCYDDLHEVSILLFSNSTLGLVSHWWTGSRQQPGRSAQSVTKIPEMMTIDPRDFTKEQFKTANDIFERFKEKDFKPANEAYNDESRKDLDRAVLVELLGLPASIMDSIDLLRYKWCSEPSVHGGKPTRPT